MVDLTSELVVKCHKNKRIMYLYTFDMIVSSPTGQLIQILTVLMYEYVFKSICHTQLKK